MIQEIWERLFPKTKTSAGDDAGVLEQIKSLEQKVELLKAELKSDIVAANESQKKINQMVGSVTQAIIWIAAIVAGLSFAKSIFWDAFERERLRSDLTGYIREEVQKGSQAVANEISRQFEAQIVPRMNRQALGIKGELANGNANDCIDRGDYIVATAHYVRSCSFFMMAGEEGAARGVFSQFTNALTHLQAKHLSDVPSGGPVGITIQMHLNNLVDQLETNNFNGRYDFQLQDLRTWIRQIEARK